MQSGTVVQKRTSDPNCRSQSTGVSQHCPESKRSLELLSRKEMQAQSTVKNRIAVSNSSPKQNRSVATQFRTTIAKRRLNPQSRTELGLEQQSQTESQCQYTESYKQKQLLSFFALEQ